MAGGGQTRAGSVEGGSAPPRRFEEASVGFDAAGFFQTKIIFYFFGEIFFGSERGT